MPDKVVFLSEEAKSQGWTESTLPLRLGIMQMISAAGDGVIFAHAPTISTRDPEDETELAFVACPN